MEDEKLQDKNIQELQEETPEETPEETLEETQQNRKNKRSGSRWFFVYGLLTGLLIAIALNGAVMLTARLTGNQQLSVQTDNVPAKEEKSDSNDNSIVTDEVVKKLGLLEEGIHANYLNDIDKESVQENIYKGLLEGMGDPYSTYYSAAEVEELRQSTEGIYGGIGAYIALDPDMQAGKITEVMPGSPALEAGIQAEDIIVKIDGEDALGLTLEEIVGKIKGKEGTQVVLTVYREGEYDYLEYTLTRKIIEAPTVSYEMLDNNIGYIKISEFDTVTTEQFKSKLQEAKDAGMKGMVLDLRNNPGGSLSAVVDIAGNIVPKGIVVYTEDKNGEREEYFSDGKNELQVPLVVLVNENSASASELLTGAIKDYKKGTILGTTTFGKGIVQKLFALSDGSAIKLTVSHYYTPNGYDIHGAGIVPDVELKKDNELYAKEGVDNQLEKAKEILAGEMNK